MKNEIIITASLKTNVKDNMAKKAYYNEELRGNI